jgi:hypothetical protein
MTSVIEQSRALMDLHMFSIHAHLSLVTVALISLSPSLSPSLARRAHADPSIQLNGALGARSSNIKGQASDADFFEGAWRVAPSDFISYEGSAAQGLLTRDYLNEAYLESLLPRALSPHSWAPLEVGGVRVSQEQRHTLSLQSRFEHVSLGASYTVVRPQREAPTGAYQDTLLDHNALALEMSFKPIERLELRGRYRSVGFGQLWTQGFFGGSAGLDSDALISQRPTLTPTDSLTPLELATLSRWDRSELSVTASARDLVLPGVSVDAGYARRNFGGQPLLPDLAALEGAPSDPMGFGLSEAELNEAVRRASEGARVDQFMFGAAGYKHPLSVSGVKLLLGLWGAYERLSSNQGRLLAGAYQPDAYSSTRVRFRPSVSAVWGDLRLMVSYEYAARAYVARRSLDSMGAQEDSLAYEDSSLTRADLRYTLGEGAEVGLYALLQSLSTNQSYLHLFATTAELTQVGVSVRFYAD